MTTFKLSASARKLPDFSFAVGIEDTFIPQSKPGLRPLEEYELTQHYQHWRQDLKRAHDLGITHIRWGVPWYKVEIEPGQFDWTWVDEVLDYMVNHLKLEPIVDLVHYGTPLWLTDSFANPDYPQRVALFASAFAQRYQHLVTCYTPLNEPTVNADFSGRQGVWPPYREGDAGYVEVLLAIAKGLQKSARAIRAVQPDAVLFAVEATHHYRALSAQAEGAAATALAHDLLAFDLVHGRVDEAHRLYGWLIENGASPAELSALRQDAVQFDVFGVNFYPWSYHPVSSGPDGTTAIGADPADGRLLIDVLRRIWEHTRLPLFITETSAAQYRRSSWMQEVDDAVRLIRLDGIPLIGLTWFPLTTMIDWEYRLTDLPLPNYLLHLGLVDCHFEEQRLVRRDTPHYQQYRALVKRGMPPLNFSSCARLRQRLRQIWQRWRRTSM